MNSEHLMINLYQVFIDYENTDDSDKQRDLAELSKNHPSLSRQLLRIIAVANSDQEKQIAQLLNQSVIEIYEQTNTSIVKNTLVGVYRIKELLGHGGMSSVYLADRDDGAFEQQVALKFLSPLLTYNQSGEILNFETQVLSKLNHPNIAKFTALKPLKRNLAW